MKLLYSPSICLGFFILFDLFVFLKPLFEFFLDQLLCVKMKSPQATVDLIFNKTSGNV